MPGLVPGIHVDELSMNERTVTLRLGALGRASKGDPARAAREHVLRFSGRRPSRLAQEGEHLRMTGGRIPRGERYYGTYKDRKLQIRPREPRCAPIPVARRSALRPAPDG